MKYWVGGVCGSLLISVLACSDAWAQATAQINGTVRDPSGAVLPGADVMATQTDTGIIRSTITNETGSFVLPNLATGPYRVEVGLPGFRTFVQTGIVLQVNSNPVINAVLELGQVTEQVEVQANAAMVETRSVGVGQVIENERILELPLNGRQVTDLVVLAGAAVQVATNNNRGMASVGISVAGSTSQGVGYYLDGAVHTNPYNNFNLPLPFPDALQEFKVETGGLSAANGWSSGASVNMVTRSGTNEFHGNLFEFLRNDLFNARNYTALTGSTLKRNQFGGTLGGPIMTNKLFFFGGYQGTTTRQDPANTEAFVPTAAMLAGDFSGITSPACIAGRTTRLPLNPPFDVNNQINPALFSKVALNITSKLPKSSDTLCGKVIFGAINKTDEHQAVGKIDYQRNASHSVFGRYMATTVSQPDPHSITPDNLLSANGPGTDQLGQSFTVGDTRLFGTNVVNSARLALNRTSVRRVGAEFFSAPEVGVNVYSFFPHYMNVSVTSGFSFGPGTGSDGTFRTTTYGLSDDLNVLRGNHQMAFGANVAHWRVNFNSQIANGSFSFSGQNTGLGLADFLTGRMTDFNQGDLDMIYMHEWYAGAYGQDTWKVTPRLTLNYGLRWEPYFPQVLRNGTIYSFSYDRFKAGIKSKTFLNAPAGFYYPGDEGFPGHCDENGKCIGSGLNIHWMNLQPRLGLAWDVNGDGRTSVRASYAYANEFVNAQFHSSTTLAPPWGNNIRIGNPPGGFEDPWLGYPGGNPFPQAFGQRAVFVPFGAYLAMPEDYNLKTTASSSWNLSIQRQLPSSMLLSVSYVGRQTAHLWRPKTINPVTFFPGNCTVNGVTSACSNANNIDLRRKLYLENPTEGQIGHLAQYDTGGTMSYHGLLTSIQRRVGLVAVTGNYTWSHCVGDSDTNSTNYQPTRGYLDINDRDLDRGNCEGDRRHLFNGTVVGETPQFTNSTLRLLATGWRLSGIYRTSSGEFLTVTSGQDRQLSGVGSQRVNQILENPYRDTSTGPLTQYLNPLAFAQPALGSIGNMRPANIRGVRTWQFDMALSRVFQFRESQNLEFRAEAYNVTNSFRPSNPGTGLNSSTFGQIRSSAAPRVMQFALKYVF